MVTKNIYLRIGFVLIICFIIFYFLYALRSVFNPLLIALLISYVLHPLVKRLQKIFKVRAVAIISIYLLFLVTAFVVIVFVVPPVLGDVYKFAGAFFIGDVYEGMEDGKEFTRGQTKLLVDYNSNDNYDPPTLAMLISRFSRFLEHKIENFPSINNAIKTKLDINKIKSYFYEKFKSTFRTEAELIKSFFNIILIYLILVPIYVIFLSFYIERIYNFFIFYLPPKHKTKISGFLHKVDAIVAAYLRGKIWIGIIKTVLTFSGLVIFGSAFPLAFAGLQFITSFVPNLFIIGGIAPNFIINAMQSGITSYATLGSLFALISIELIEGFILTPIILGKNVGLHPVVVFIVLLAGAKLFGVLGLLIAIPTVSIIKVIWTDFVGPALKEALSHPPFNE